MVILLLQLVLHLALSLKRGNSSLVPEPLMFQLMPHDWSGSVLNLSCFSKSSLYYCYTNAEQSEWCSPWVVSCSNVSGGCWQLL